MSRVSVSKSGSHSVPQNASLERHTQRFLELRRGLEQIEYFCKGTVLKRMMKCGKARCACASDATKRHGPYFELTYKANGKTVNVKLSPEAVTGHTVFLRLSHSSSRRNLSNCSASEVHRVEVAG